MEILITGVAGFVGSNLAEACLREGYDVYGIDNFSYGNERNLLNLRNYDNFHFYHRDVADPDCFRDMNVDLVVHLASQKIPRYTTSLRTLDENALMTSNVINYCLRSKARLLFSSTSDVYGKNPEIPYHENSNLVLGPTDVKRWAYAVSKIHSEHKIIAQNQANGLEYTIVRFFGSYGRNQNLTWWGGPQSVFIQRALLNETIELHGDGLQTRTFTYIKDTVQGLMCCIKNPDSKNDVFNIASEPNWEISIKDLAFLIWELVNPDNPKPKIKYIPYESFGKYEDVRRRVPDITKIKEKLKYKPLFDLKKGLIETIDWQRNLLQN